MIPDSVVKRIENKYQHLRPLLNESSRRLWAATEAEALGYGGIVTLHRATGLSQNTIRAGLKELNGESTQWLVPERIRLRWRRAKTSRRTRTSDFRSVGQFSRTHKPGRARMSFALDVQECQSTG